MRSAIITCVTLTAARLFGFSSLSLLVGSSSSFFSGAAVGVVTESGEELAAETGTSAADAVVRGATDVGFFISRGASAAGLERIAWSSAVIPPGWVSVAFPPGTGM